ncbi:aspartic peptidase domain-containing protein [Nemania serpens]|nr:aspartic peptidase domain-containing protein [Nemania serpens]
MLFILLLVSVAVGIASDIASNGARSLRLPIRSRSSTLVGARGDPGYGQPPLRTNATQKHYLSPYTVELAVGSPPQLVYPAIDLFSNNLWLNPDCYTSLSLDACCANGNYNPDVSGSLQDPDCSLHWDFSTPYGGASGCYVVDEVEFAGTSLGYIQVGIADESWAQTAGRLGLGFGGQASDGDVSIIDRLVSEGLITTRQFSIALGSANPSADLRDDSADADVGLGELLFSGLNTRKYAGELRKLYSHPGLDGDPRHYVQLTALGVVDPNNCIVSSVPQPWRRAFFDYTTVFSYFPWAYMETLIGFFPEVTYNYTDGVYQVPCYHRFHDASIGFYFDTLLIRVPFRDFILQVDGICYLGAVQNVEDDEAILGQNFLRGAYTAFDLDDEAMYIAQLGFVGLGGRRLFYLNNALYEHKHDYDALDTPLDNNHVLQELEDYLNASLFNTIFEGHDKSLDDLNEPLHKPLLNSLFDSFNNFSNKKKPHDILNLLVIGHIPVRRDHLPVRRIIHILDATEHGVLLEQRLLHRDVRQHKPVDATAQRNINSDIVIIIGDIDADVRPGVDGDVNEDSIVSERDAIHLLPGIAREDGHGDGWHRHVDRLHA